MTLKALSITAVLSLFTIASCHNKPGAQISRTSWIFPYPTAASETRVGKQMPPHPEPDAVIINLGGVDGHHAGGGFPSYPVPEDPFFGIFGTPGGPGVFGVPPGFPGGPAPTPGTFGFPGLPNGFGFPRGPNMFFPQGHNNPVPPNGPGVFFPRGQGNPAVPNGPGVQFGQSNPEFAVGTGVLGVPNGPPRPVEPTRFVFTVAGNGNVPGVPGFFVPGRSPNLPENPHYLPGNGGFVPQSFVPGGMNGFPPGGVFPGAFFPEAPFVSGKPEVPGHFPRKETNGGREMYDEPEASLFPMVKRSPLFSHAIN